MRDFTKLSKHFSNKAFTKYTERFTVPSQATARAANRLGKIELGFLKRYTLPPRRSALTRDFTMSSFTSTWSRS